MLEIERIEEWRGRPVVDHDGDKVGKLEEIYIDLDSGEPGVGCVKTGLFGRHLSLVPLEGAAFSRDYVRIPFTQEQVKAAPRAEPGGQMTRDEEVALFRHYGLEVPAGGRDGSRHVRYESPAVEAQRRAAAEEASRRADALEAEAERKATEADEAAREAHAAQDHARRAQGESEHALRRAQEERRAAEQALEG